MPLEGFAFSGAGTPVLQPDFYLDGARLPSPAKRGDKHPGEASSRERVKVRAASA